MGSNDLLFPLKVEFDQIASQDKKKDKKQKKNNDMKGKKQDVRHRCRRKMLSFPYEKFNAEE